MRFPARLFRALEHPGSVLSHTRRYMCKQVEDDTQLQRSTLMPTDHGGLVYGYKLGPLIRLFPETIGILARRCNLVSCFIRSNTMFP